MVEAVIRFLIAVCLLVLCVFLVIWVFGQLGIALPAMVVKILWIIVVLLAILYLVQLLRPHAGKWFP